MPSSITSSMLSPQSTLSSVKSQFRDIKDFPSQISSIKSVGTEGEIRANTERKTNKNILLVTKEDLHKCNGEKQVNKLIQLFKDNPSLATQGVTTEMISHALNSNGMGNLNQQSLHYRPESSLIILTLLQPNEMVDGLLDCAARMIKDMQTLSGNNDKKIIRGSVNEFDRKIKKSLSKINENIFSAMENRFKNEYIKSEFEKLLMPHLSEGDIKNLSIEDCLLSTQYQQKQSEIAELKNAYQKDGINPSVDKGCYMNNMFGILEEYLEIVKTLTVTVGWEDKTPTPDGIKQSTDNKAQSPDEIDGVKLPHEKAENLPNYTSNSHNTTTITNYFSSPLRESIKQATNQNNAMGSEPHQEPQAAVESEGAYHQWFDDTGALPQKGDQIGVKLPRVALKIQAQEPLPDYDFFHHSAQNSQEIDTVKSRHFIEPSHVDAPWEPSSTQEEKIVQSTKDQFKLATELAQKNSQPMDIKPKMGSHYGSYLIDNKVPNGVKLTHNREPVQNKSPKQAESESYLAIKNASHYRTSYMNNDDKVVLSAEGLMTRNLNEKLAYINKPQGE
ncbi:hypothetical protein [Providencia rettgeri]|uniref:hypothetical protein n=1 Tax=Providencia rettgeri TaxID=587 RepID=UPI002362EB9C|nr:hypothetical protein [Providencia rettgeri]